MFGGEANQNPRESKLWTSMQINYLIFKSIEMNYSN